MSAVMPASIASWGPSAKGKKASEASTAPASSWGRNSRAFSIAMRTESTRLICPAPIPIVALAPSSLPAASTIALERTWRHTFQAKSSASHWSSSGASLLTRRICSRVSETTSRVCTSCPPITGLPSTS